MWVNALCPRCGVRSEIDLSEVGDEVCCTRCFQKFCLPVHLRQPRKEQPHEEYVLAGMSDESSLDSSFWLS